MLKSYKKDPAKIKSNEKSEVIYEKYEKGMLTSENAPGQKDKQGIKGNSADSTKPSVQGATGGAGQQDKQGIKGKGNSAGTTTPSVQGAPGVGSAWSKEDQKGKSNVMSAPSSKQSGERWFGFFGPGRKS